MSNGIMSSEPCRYALQGNAFIHEERKMKISYSLLTIRYTFKIPEVFYAAA